MLINGKNSSMVCPHCEEVLEGAVSEYSVSAVNGRQYGPDTRAVDRCYECHQPFAVTEIAEEEYQVDALDEGAEFTDSDGE